MQVRALALTLCVAYYPAVSALFLDFGPVDKVGTVSGMAGVAVKGKEREEREAVSYTHLTLPTICSV